MASTESDMFSTDPSPGTSSTAQAALSNDTPAPTPAPVPAPSQLNGTTSIFTVTPQTSPILFAPIYRELNYANTNSTSPGPWTEPLPLRPSSRLQLCVRPEALAPAAYRELNGIAPIFRVTAQGVPAKGGTEGSFNAGKRLGREPPFLTLHAYQGHNDRDHASGSLETAPFRTGPGAADVDSETAHSYQGRLATIPGKEKYPADAAPTRSMAVFDALTAYQVQARLATIPEDDEDPSYTTPLRGPTPSLNPWAPQIPTAVRNVPAIAVSPPLKELS